MINRGNNLRRRLQVLTALTALFALSACSATEGTQTPASMADIQSQAASDGGPRQSEILQDDTVSTSEFTGAVDDYLSCLADKGLESDYVAVNPVDSWRPIVDVFWPGLTEDEGRGREEECMRTTLRYVTYGYDLGDNDLMDPAMMAGVQACLSKTDQPVDGTERSLGDLIPLGAGDEARAAAVETCIFAVGQTYPGVILVY